MKVLIYFDKNTLRPTGGPNGYLYNLYKELKKPKIKDIYFIDSFSLKLKSIIRKIYKKLPQKIQNKCFNIVKVNHDKNIYDTIFDTRKRETNINLNKYDIIHFHDTYSMYMIKDSLENYKGKIIITSHSPKAFHLEIIDSMLKEVQDKIKDKLNKLEIIDEYAFNRADYILFPTKYSEECYYNTWSKYKEIRKKNKNKFIYLPTGINPVTIKEKKDDIRKKYNIPKDAFVISYVGRHNEVKGYSKLKEIGKKILDNNDNIYFLIAGKEEPLKGLNHKNWIEVGWTNTPHDLINASDLFILPNQETYFDLIMIEVLSVGKTVLATNTGGNKYFKKYKNSGIFYYEYEDVDQAVKKIYELKSKNLKPFEKNNKKIMNKDFTIKVFTKKYKKILKSILKQK